MRGIPKGDELVKVHTHLFKGDVAHVKRAAAQQSRKWQVELRHILRRAIRGEQREVLVIKERE